MDTILTLNAGSSSLKFALFALDRDHQTHAVLRGQIEGVGVAPHLTAKDARDTTLVDQRWPLGVNAGYDAVLRPLLAWLQDHLGTGDLVAVGHRIVHGGAAFDAPIVIDEAVLQALNALSPLAPLHQPHNLAAVRAAQAALPHLPQVACFDTAFHHGHADVVTRFALPRVWHDRGVRRYGFHGLSYAFVAGRLRELDPALASGKVIVAHLGAGASLCALQDGRSIDSTMSFTALDGLMMATRCGALDPGVILYLEQHFGLTAEAVQILLYEQSGLLGVSGLSSDMRTLLESDAASASQAIELFTFRIAREIGALTSSLYGLDGIVFTGGIGENAPPIRAAVAARLAWMGLHLDPQANALGPGAISAGASSLKAWVIATDEEAMIASMTASAALTGARRSSR